MTLRLRVPRSESEAEVSKLYKLVGRAYVFWLVGLIAGAVNLRPTSINVPGVSFSIDKPEAVVGLLFLMTLLCYVAMFGLAFLGGPIGNSPSAQTRSAIIYGAKWTIGRRTLKNIERWQLQTIKSSARAALNIRILARAFYAFLPLAHIFLFRLAEATAALRLLFA